MGWRFRSVQNSAPDDITTTRYDCLQSETRIRTGTTKFRSHTFVRGHRSQSKLISCQFINNLIGNLSFLLKKSQACHTLTRFFRPEETTHLRGPDWQVGLSTGTKIHTVFTPPRGPHPSESESDVALPSLTRCWLTSNQ